MPVRVLAERRCRQCGASIGPRRAPGRRVAHAIKYCSRQCQWASRRRPPVLPKTKPIILVACAECGQPFEQARTNQSYCSVRCRTRRYGRAQLRALRDRTERQCLECATVFAPLGYGDKRRLFCSTKCGLRNGGRASKAVRRARLRRVLAERIDPMVIFARDVWACCACRVETPRALRGTVEPNAPELDHIVPVSQGGAHMEANVQLLCRRCNQLKGGSPSQPLTASRPQSGTQCDAVVYRI